MNNNDNNTNQIFEQQNDTNYVSFDEYGNINDTNKKKKSDLWAKLASLLFAVLLWFYVAGIQSPNEEQTFSDIPVALTELPENSGLSVISGYDTMVNVTLSGKRSDLMKIKSTDIKPYVDLSGVTHAGEIPLSISVKPISGVSVAGVNPGMVYAYIDKTTTKSIPVEVDYTGGTTDKDIIIDELIPSQKSITIKGPAETIEKVAGAVVFLDIGFVDRSFEVREKISLVDVNRKVITNPYITLSISEMKVTVNINKYKTVPIKLKTSGVVAAENISYTIDPAEVTISGESGAVDSVEYIETELVDETKVDGESTYQLKLSLPENVSAKLDKETVKVDISLKNNASKVVTLTADNLFPSNENQRYEVSLISEFLNVNLRGDTKELSKYKTNQIYAQYDVSAVSDTGIIKLPVKITLPNSEKIYVSGDYYIEVESKLIKKK